MTTQVYYQHYLWTQ